MTDQHLQKEAIKSEPGKKVLNFLITDANRRKLSRLLKNKARTKMIRQVSRDQESHLDDILPNALKHIMPVTQPPVMISQVHHSGGSLLNRLFDGHPELNVLPHEFGSGPIATGRWPNIDLDNNARHWFDILYKKVDTDFIRKRFGRGDTKNAAIPFVFVPLIQEQIFLKYLESLETIERRDVIAAYITACFGAWLDYQNLSGDKKFTIACAPDLATQPDSTEAFFAIYPESRLISLVRNPEDWLACARTRKPEFYENARSAVNHWKESVRAVLEVHRKFKDRVCLIRFEDLKSRTDAVMHYLSEFLKISFEDILLIPTFNSIPLQSSISPEKDQTGVASGYLIDSQELDQNDRTLIKGLTHETYKTLLREVVVF
jgi:hypothetical protein